MQLVKQLEVNDGPYPVTQQNLARVPLTAEEDGAEKNTCKVKEQEHGGTFKAFALN